MKTSIFESHRHGFTLVELLVVISIIALLSAVVLAALSQTRVTATNARIQEQMLQIRDGIELDRGASGNYNIIASSYNNGPNCNVDKDLVSSLVANTSEATIASSTAALSGGEIVPNGYSPGAVAGSYSGIPGFMIITNANSWTNGGSSSICASTTVPTQYAIYAAYASPAPTTGIAAYYCLDSSGRTTSKASAVLWTNLTEAANPSMCN